MDYTTQSEVILIGKRNRLRDRNRDHFDFSPYPDGQLVRVDRGEVFYVENGNGISLNQLSGGKLSNDGSHPTIIKGKPYTWANVVEGANTKTGLKAALSALGNAAKSIVAPKKAVVSIAQDPNTFLKGSDVVKKAVIAVGSAVGGSALLNSAANAGNPLAKKIVDPIKSIIKPKTGPVSSVIAGGQPVNADVVTTATTSTPTNSSFANMLLQKAASVSPELKQKVISRGQDLLTDKLGDLVRSPELLPKTKGLNDAIKYADAGGYNDSVYSAMPGGSINPIYLMAGLALLVTVLFMFKQNN